MAGKPAIRRPAGPKGSGARAVRSGTVAGVGRERALVDNPRVAAELAPPAAGVLTSAHASRKQAVARHRDLGIGTGFL